MSSIQWSLGLRNHATGKYLTQESFGFKMNANGSTLKKKQTLYLESNEHGVFIKTHLGRYIYATKDGEFKGDADSPSRDQLWTIEPQADGTWALKSVATEFYLHGTGDDLRCFTKEIPADGKWVVHLAMHPQINLSNLMRKRYIHLEDDELHCNEDVPWGEDALLTLVFFDQHRDGRYGIMGSNGKYLNANGRMTSDAGQDAMFLLGFHDDQVSFRDEAGRFLSCVGAKGTVKVNKDKVTKDELFAVKDSEPQFTIVDDRGKYVSVRSSDEVKADQPDVQDSERFQFEVLDNGKVAVLTNKSSYWSVGGDSAVLLSKTQDPTTHFTVEWHGNRVKFIAANGKYITVKSNGSLTANGNGSESTAAFCTSLINRPQILLRGQYGFVGQKGSSGRTDVNKANGDIYQVVPNDGAYALKGPKGFWAVDGDGVFETNAGPVLFFFEFVERSKVLIKHADTGMYLQGEQNGGFKANGQDKNINTLWEF